MAVRRAFRKGRRGTAPRLRRLLDRFLRQMVYALVLVALLAAAHGLNWFGWPPMHVYVAYVLSEPVDVEDVVSRVENWVRRWLPEEAVWPWRGQSLPKRVLFDTLPGKWYAEAELRVREGGEDRRRHDGFPWKGGARLSAVLSAVM